MRYLKFMLALAVVFGNGPAGADTNSDSRSIPAIAVDASRLQSEFWVRRLHGPDRVLMSAASIAEQNSRLLHEDASFHDLSSLPATVPGEMVRAWISALSRLPQRPLWNEDRTPVGDAQRKGLLDSIAVDPIVGDAIPVFGLVVARADLRTFPTRARVFSSSDDTDIDRFQESALFPGTPVAIVHESRDRHWWFVVSPLYSAWIEKSRVATGSREAVLGQATRMPRIVVTGANVHTVFTPEQPALSGLQLDMGLSLPLLSEWPASEPVNGQGVSAAYVVQMPLREADGSLRLLPALVPRGADVAEGALPLTATHLLRQAFKFLGERYGWGSSYDTRDCSGFVSEVYRSFGILLPRNSGDQAMSPALNRTEFDAASSHAARLAAMQTLDVGDLIYIPGHVMLVIGSERGSPVVIHDSAGVTYRDADGTLVRQVLNGVAVTPFRLMLTDTGEPYLDRIQSIVRMRPVQR